MCEAMPKMQSRASGARTRSWNRTMAGIACRNVEPVTQVIGVWKSGQT